MVRLADYICCKQWNKPETLFKWFVQQYDSTYVMQKLVKKNQHYKNSDLV